MGGNLPLGSLFLSSEQEQELGKGKPNPVTSLLLYLSENQMQSERNIKKAVKEKRSTKEKLLDNIDRQCTGCFF